MHFCEAHVAIGNDDQNVLYRGRFNPVSWPEIEVLRYIHGDDAVRDVKPFVSVRQSARQEHERLVLRYGPEPVNFCFTGRPPRMDLEAPDVELAYGEMWNNPLTGANETVETPLDEPKVPLAKSPKRAA